MIAHPLDRVKLLENSPIFLYWHYTPVFSLGTVAPLEDDCEFEGHRRFAHYCRKARLRRIDWPICWSFGECDCRRLPALVHRSQKKVVWEVRSDMRLTLVTGQPGAVAN